MIKNRIRGFLNALMGFPMVGKIERKVSNDWKLALAGVVTLMVAGMASAATFYVDASRPNDTGDGLSWATAKQTLQAAVDLAITSGDVVLVTNGTYASGSMVYPGHTASNRVCVTNDISLQSVNGPDVTFIVGAPDTTGGSASNGPAALRGVYLADGASLSGFTVTNGYTTATTSGGGISCAAGAVVSNCVVSGNKAGNDGGGVYRGYLFDCVVSGNVTGDDGGGVYQGIMDSVTVENNTAGDEGGGGSSCAGSLCIVRNNSAENGGGVNGGYMTNCLITGNSAVYDGGGAYYATIYACTVTDNTADQGGGIYGGTIAASVLYYNESSGLQDNFNPNSSIHYCCTTPRPAGGRSIVTEPPMLSGVNNPHLLAGSPCIDKASLYGSFDIDHEARNNGGPDYGCDERWPAAITGELSAVVNIPQGTNVVVGYPLRFKAMSEGRADSLLWNFEDGHTVTNLAVCEHVFTNAGDHTVMLRLTNVMYSTVATAVVHVVELATATWYVATNGNDGAAGTSWATAKQTIQAAVDLATNLVGELVLVSNGVYNMGGAVAPGHMLTNRVCITSPIRLKSVNGPEVTVIEGAPGSNGSNDVDSVRGLFIIRGATLSGFGVRNGYSSASNEFGYFGGGIFAEGNDAVVTNCTIVGNSSMWCGGGVYHGTYNNCILTGNATIDQGGAAFEATLNECVISSNTADMGGGVSFVVADRCELVGNTARYGGAAYGYRNQLTHIYNSAFRDNIAEAGGAAYGGNLRPCALYNCTVTGNSATNGEGGGAYGCDIENSIVYFNTSVSNRQDIDYGGHGVTYNTCASDGVTHGVGANITNDPQFVDRAAGDFRLMMESPCVDVGELISAPTNLSPYDIRGYSRIISTNIDMGAFEAPLATVTPTNGALGGGTLVVMTNVAPAISAITNVLVGSNAATAIPAQGTNWIAFRAPRGSLYGEEVDVVLQSSVADDVSFVRAYTYDTPPVSVYVDANNGNDANSGESWGQALQTIQSAVDLVATGGVVTVTNGVYDAGSAVTPGYAATNRVTITKALTLQSVNGSAVTTIAGAAGSNGSNDVDSIRGVYAYISSGSVLISGFTITNGYSCSTGNTHRDRNGGGAFIGNNCTISNCVISGNMANQQAGGVYLYLGGRAQDCSILGNKSSISYGGGVGLFSSCELNNCIVQENEAQTSAGGGIYVNSIGTVNNCLVVSNTASIGGGGIYVLNGGTVNNTTISRNSAPSGSGGGVNMENSGQLNNCIVWTNSAFGAQDIQVTTGVVIRYTCASQNVGSPAWTGAVECLTNVNPMFVSEASGNFRLQELSPCVNYGNNTYAMTNTVNTDLAGNPRVFDTVVDLGAYELQKLQQTITFTLSSPNTYGFSVNPGATASSGLNVVLTSSDESICTNAGPWLYFVGTGTCDIVASQPGNGLWAMASNVTRELTVNPKGVTVSGASANNKVYDATVAATLSGGSLSGVLSGDTVTLENASTGTFAYALADTNIAVTSYMSLGGADAANYALTAQPSLMADITQKGLTVTGAVAQSRAYDATTSATISGGGLSGVVSGDTVTLLNASAGTFAQAEVGTNIVVSTAMSIGGADGSNYSLSQPSLAADITAKGLVVTGAVAVTKIYDGTTAATISGAGLSGVVGFDSVSLQNATTGTFATANAGAGIAVTSYMTISGADSTNYSLAQPSLSATILKKNQTITFDPIGDQFWTNTLGLAATSDSGLTVSFNGQSGPVQVVGTNASFTDVGAVAITASQAGNGNYNAATTVTNSFNVTGPGMLMLGTNSVAITNNQEAGVAAGTDYGLVLVGSSPVTNVFGITNNGTAAMSISGVATSGAAAGLFTVSGVPATVAVGTVETFEVVFTPTSGGAKTASIVFTNNGPSSPFTMNVAGFGMDGSIGLGTNTLDFSGTYSDVAPTSQILVMTNSGTSSFIFTNSVAYGGAASGWLTVSADSMNVPADSSMMLTNAVSLSGLDVGSYSCTVTVYAAAATNSPQSYSVNLTVNKADQTISFSNPGTQLTTNTLGLSATSGSGLPVTFAVASGSAVLAGGTNLSFTGSGAVVLTGNQGGNGNYNAAPTVTNTFTVNKALASVTLTNLSQTYNGSSRIVGATTVPTGLTVNVTYNGGGSAPMNAGSYTVVGTVDDTMYQGVRTNTLVVAKASQSIVFLPIPPQHTTNTLGLRASSTSGGTVSFRVAAGPGVLAGTNLSFTGAGTVYLAADQTGTVNYAAAPSITNMVAVTRSYQRALGFAPSTYMNYMTTNSLMTTGGSGSGLVSYAVSSGPALLTNSTGLVIQSGTGVVSVVATKAQDAMFFSTAATATVFCARADQSITFPEIGIQVVSNTVGLSASVTSGLEIQFGVATGPGHVMGTNLTLSATGTVFVTAAQAGNSNWNAAVTVTQEVLVLETPPVGNVSCVINPEGARTLGRWRVDGGDWHTSGALATNLSPGNYEVDFKAAAGWRTPTSIQVAVTYDQTTVCTGRYVMRSVPNDFDSDGISDIGCYAPEAGYWYIYKSKSQELWVTNYAGGDGTIPVTGDFDGDSVCDYGTYYAPSGWWRIMRSTTGPWDNNFGFEGTVPVTGDLDGDGTLDFGCYYDQTGWWFIYKSSTGFWSTQFGYGGTVPVTGDFDGDGIGDFGCYYAPDGWWYIYKSSIQDLWTTQFGYAGTVPVTGDFDGDGVDDFGCYSDEGGNWYLYRSRDGFYTTAFGYAGTVPISGDYDGDGISDFGCYYAPGGNWYVFMSASQELWQNQFGYDGTLPLK